MNNLNTSFALITRLQRSETPFLNEFLAYYTTLGIDHFYLVNTEPENRQEILTHISPEFLEQITLIDKLEGYGLNECPNCALTKIKETFLLHVDMDEFLYLDGMKLAEFAAKEGLLDENNDVHEYFFRWVMAPLCNDNYASSIKEILNKGYFYPSNIGKSLVQTKYISSINPHHFDLVCDKNRKTFDPDETNYFIFHVASRGFFDIINKIQYGQYQNIKQSESPDLELSDLFFNFKSKSLPSRFSLLAFQSRFEPHSIIVDFDYPVLKHQTNTALLEQITLGGLEERLGTDIKKVEVENLLRAKIAAHEIPDVLVNMVIAGKIDYLVAMEYIDSPKLVGARVLYARIIRKLGIIIKKVYPKN